MEEMQQYIGVKRIRAIAMTAGEAKKVLNNRGVSERDDSEDGYLVQYTDTYQSWSPKDIFEAAYLLIGGDGTKITQDVVTSFMDEVVASQFDEKTTIVTAETVTGFKQYEVSSCVDPKNYDAEIGKNIGKKRIEDTLWQCLGFVLQWANYGLKKK